MQDLNLAVIVNCTLGVLIDRRGRYVWCCYPRFGIPRTSFTGCTLWYIDALAAIGRREEGREIFEHLLSCRNHLGLLIVPATVQQIPMLPHALGGWR